MIVICAQNGADLSVNLVILGGEKNNTWGYLRAHRAHLAYNF